MINTKAALTMSICPAPDARCNAVSPYWKEDNVAAMTSSGISLTQRLASVIQVHA